MARYAVGVVGAAVGAYLGGPSGAALGWSLGTAIGGIVFPDNQLIRAPRLEDLTVQTSSYGRPIPEFWGDNRTAGIMIWTDGIEEIVTEESAGGKGGGGTKVEKVSYYSSFAILFGEGPFVGFRRIWADGSLIYDNSENITAETYVASNQFADSIRFYPGSYTQERDPLIEAVEGTDNTPAYLGRCYMVFERYNVTGTGGRRPQISVELIKEGSTGLAEVRNVWQDFDNGYQRDSSCLYIDRDGVAHMCQLTWSATINHYLVLPNGDIRSVSFGDAVYNNEPCGTGASDEPAYMANGWFNDKMYYYQLTPDGPSLAAVHQLDGAYFDARFSGVTDWFEKRGDYIYYARWWQNGRIYRGRARNNETWGTEFATLFASGDALGDSIAGFCCGDSEIYVLLDTDQIAVMDLDGAEKYRWDIPFSPAIVYDGLTTVAYMHSDVDGVIYVRTGGGYIHKIDRGTYQFLGTMHPNGWQTANVTAFAARRGLITMMHPHSQPHTHNKIASYAEHLISTTKPTLDDIVGGLLQRLGLTATDYNLVDLEGIDVDGYVRTAPMPVRSALEPLRAAYAFDMIESDWVIKAVRRGGSVVRRIHENDLGWSERGELDAITHDRDNETELPRRVTVGYISEARDFQNGSQHAQRISTDAKLEENLNVAIVLEDNAAAQMAAMILDDRWMARDRFSFVLAPEQMQLEPTDIIEIERIDGTILTVRLLFTSAGIPGPVQCQAVAEDVAHYTQTVIGYVGEFEPQTVSLNGPTELFLLDLPPLRDADNDAGIYVGVYGYFDGWRGAQLYKSSDGEAYSAALASTRECITGKQSGTFAAGPTEVWDDANTLTIRTEDGGSLASCTDEQALSYANTAAIGAHGRWEIVSYVNVTDNGDGTYTLSRLIRGRRGTEHAIDQHVSGDRFVLLSSSTLSRLELQLSERAMTRYYKPVSFGKVLEDADAQTFAGDAEALKPFSPVHIEAARDDTGNITLTWVRRSRIGGEWNDYQDTPIGEDSEAYEVDILNGASVVRTISGLSSESASYSAANQVTDFGGAQAEVDVKVYQLSAQVGRGRAGMATV